MLQAYKYRVKPSKAIEDKLNERLEICRELYNAALQERREAYKLRGKSISYLEQANQLPAIKASREDIKAVHSQVLQDVLKRVDRAMDGFYRRVKKGERGGYPRYKGKNRYQSFTYPQGGWKLEGDKLTLSKLGSSTRWHKCPHCGLVLHRDKNAARNILARGINLLLAEGLAVTREA